MATRAKAPAATTRTTRSAAAARAPAMVQAAPAKTSATTKTTKSRKPFTERDNTIPAPQKTTRPKVTKYYSSVSVDENKELIKAYLRIRPDHGDEPSSAPYLKSLSPTSVEMMDPSGPSRFRMHPQVQVYTFDHVFPPETQQSDFFTTTTLPLVKDLLSGQNGLVFTYGVTNSGKTYTIQGGSAPGSAGILPRTLDTVFNSLEGLHSDAPYRPVRIAGIERIPDGEQDPLDLVAPSNEKAIADALGERIVQDRDVTALKVDRNYEYAIWVSYAEVYNEKVYDLLADDEDNNETEAPNLANTGYTNAFARANLQNQKKLPRSTSTWQSLASLTNSASSSLSGGDVLLVKRKALVLKNDLDSGGKYAAGLRRIRVHSAEEAQRVLRAGNIHRRVFGTLANAASSRSHGIFTLTCVRIHRGERIRNGGDVDEDSVLISRLSIVDLAGSERTKNTQNTGERLKEAGSINKSLMVLGQCMEALRTNQRRMASTLAAPGRGMLDASGGSSTPSGIPTLKRKPNLTLVPFRHSKLTELFQDFFVNSGAGTREGAVAMIVNVNPYDTGFDENAHVMRFAAVAREVTVLPAQSQPARPRSPTKVLGNGKTKSGIKFETKKTKATEKDGTNHRKVTITTVTNGGKGRKFSEAQYEIVEEEEDQNSSDGSDELSDPLVDSLFDELEDLRIRLYESEMRCAVIEAETREEVMREMEERMLNMERVFARRLKSEVEQNEMKTDAKIDMLHQFGAFNGNVNTQDARKSTKAPASKGVKSRHFATPPKRERQAAASDEEDEENLEENSYDVEGSSEDGEDGDSNENHTGEEEGSDDGNAEEDDDETESPSPSSPLHYRTVRLSKAEKKSLQGGPPCIGLREEEMSIDEVDADETMTHGSDEDEDEDEDDEGESVADTFAEEEEDDDDAYTSEVSEDEEWASSRGGTPSTTASFKEANTPKPIKKIDANAKFVANKVNILAKAKTSTRGVSDIQRKMDVMTLEEEEEVMEVPAPTKGKRMSKRNTVPAPPVEPAVKAGSRRSTRGKS